MRWWKLAGIATAALAALAAVTWAIFWIRPPEPAQLEVFFAGYDNTLAVPPNPYGKASAHEFANLAKPGGWLGTRSRLNGSTTPRKLSRSGLTDLFPASSKCVVVVLAAHGGRDRDGAFLFPEGATADPTVRVRVAKLIEQLAALPATQQKLLILDATEQPAYDDLGLVHNDFASAVEDFNDAIAKVPNLAVFMSTGPDQRSWTSPEWGQSSFLHHVLIGIQGAADANGDKRITAGELVRFVTPRVHDWARDNRGALQTPVLLPKGEEGMRRVQAMHLAMTDGPPPEEAAPTPFDPPPELEQQWQEYRALATAYVPPTAYTPHLWRQYEAWTLRYEQHIIAGDAEGARNARAKATELKRLIEAARRLDITPQTLTLQSAVGGLPWIPTVPASFKVMIEQLSTTDPAERATRWANMRSVAGYDPETTRLFWCRALVEWAAVDPAKNLPTAPALVLLVTQGMTVRPAEVNFLLMLARYLPPIDRKENGVPIGNTLRQRLLAEQAASCLQEAGYPYSEQVLAWASQNVTAADGARRRSEDYRFASREYTAPPPTVDAGDNYNSAAIKAAQFRDLIATIHIAADRLPTFTEWVARGPADDPDNRLERDRLFRDRAESWHFVHTVAFDLDTLAPSDWQSARDRAVEAFGTTQALEQLLAAQVNKLLTTRPEFEARPTPRIDVVKWWHNADDALTALPPDAITPTQRVDLVREFRRVSRQLLVTSRTQREMLPEVTPELTRERAFEAARRRGLFLVGRVGGLGLQQLDPPLGELVFRFERFAEQADGRQSLAEAATRLGELSNGSLIRPDVWIRLAPAHGDVSDAPLEQLRRKRVRDFLVAQARRTYLDHWYGEGGTRYYHTAIEHLAADAKTLLPEQRAKDDPFALYLVGEPPFPVTPATRPRYAVTDEPKPELRVTFDRHPPPDIDGFPVFWSTPPFPLPKPEPETRVPVPTDKQAALPPFVRPIARPTGTAPVFPVAESGTAHITGFFRGRTTAADAVVDVFRLPDRVAVTTPGLTSTAIAVRADLRMRGKYGIGTGAIAFVLDCSGSLAPPDPKDPTNPGLYPVALKALNELISQMPPGTIITVSVFGQRMPGVEVPEKTIREVLPPTQLTFDSGKIIEQINNDVGSLEPWNPSPIMRAAIRAKESIKNENVPFKAVVVITDGVDNRFAEDPENKKKRTIRDALRAEFPDAGVSLSVVALPVETKPEQAVQDEFKEVEKLRPAGKFVTTKNVQELVEWLRSGLNPRVRFSLDRLVVQGGGADLTAGTETTDNWYSGRLEPGTYQLRVEGAKNFYRTVKLEPGGRLLLDLSENQGVITASRHWYADTAPGIKSGKPTDLWRFSLLQNRSEAGGLRLFTAIEPKPQLTDVLSASRIGDVWYELSPDGFKEAEKLKPAGNVLPGAERVAARWRAAPGYPSPAWSVDVPGWPVVPGSKAPASPVVEAWWQPERPFPAVGEWRLAPGEALISEKPRPIKIGDTALSLETVSEEEHSVEVTPDGKLEPRKCLVVRISHPAGNPVWVRPVGIPPKDPEARLYQGSEVRVYRKANRVTCVFWGIDMAKVTGFEVVPLNESLKRAAELGFHSKLETVPGPTDNSPRPEPPVDPK
jgi:hypothetical protein